MTLELDGEQANYLGNVMRMGAGDELLLFDGRIGRMARASRRGGQEAHDARLERRMREREDVPDLWLAFAPIKTGADRLAGRESDRARRRAAAAGHHRSARSSTAFNLDRLRAHMPSRPPSNAGAPRCRRSPSRCKLRRLAARPATPSRTLYFADEAGGEPAAERCAPGPAAILIGSGRRLHRPERAAIRAAARPIAISLGPRILRAETAALAALAAWMAAAGDWR